MVNTLNKQIVEELNTLFNEAQECVLVDFHGLDVDEINRFRSTLTAENIRVQVVKNSLAAIVLRDMNRDGFEEMLKGPTAVVWGGEDIIKVCKSVHAFAKKTKKLRIKGGFAESQTLDPEAVVKLTSVPDRPVLLASIASAMVSPLQGIAGGLSQILASVAGLIDALREKREGGEGGASPAPEEGGGA